MSLSSAPGTAPKVADCMARKLVTFTPEMDIMTAMQVLLKKHISGAPVVNAEGHLVGVLSKKDCLRVVFTASYHKEWGGSVGDYMTRDVQTIDADTDLVTAAKKFVEGPYRRYPVMRGGRLVGQVSRFDILQALLREW